MINSTMPNSNHSLSLNMDWTDQDPNHDPIQELIQQGGGPSNIQCGGSGIGKGLIDKVLPPVINGKVHSGTKSKVSKATAVANPNPRIQNSMNKKPKKKLTKQQKQDADTYASKYDHNLNFWGQLAETVAENSNGGNHGPQHLSAPAVIPGHYPHPGAGNHPVHHPRLGFHPPMKGGYQYHPQEQWNMNRWNEGGLAYAQHRPGYGPPTFWGKGKGYPPPQHHPQHPLNMNYWKGGPPHGYPHQQGPPPGYRYMPIHHPHSQPPVQIQLEGEWNTNKGKGKGKGGKQKQGQNVVAYQPGHQGQQQESSKSSKDNSKQKPNQQIQQKEEVVKLAPPQQPVAPPQQQKPQPVSVQQQQPIQQPVNQSSLISPNVPSGIRSAMSKRNPILAFQKHQLAQAEKEQRQLEHQQQIEATRLQKQQLEVNRKQKELESLKLRQQEELKHLRRQEVEKKKEERRMQLEEHKRFQMLQQEEHLRQVQIRAIEREEYFDQQYQEILAIEAEEKRLDCLLLIL